MTGIQDPSSIEQYVRDTWGDANSCMSPNDRAEHVVADVNSQLAQENIPQVGWRFNSAHGTGAVFDFSSWYIELGESPYSIDVAENATPEQQAWQVSAVYHEARHAEQWYRMARERIGLGATPQQAAQQMGIPEWVADYAAMDPITQCDASQYESEQWYQSIYGEGAAHRQETLSDVDANYDAYRSLPEEQDAWRTGDAVSEEFQEQSR